MKQLLINILLKIITIFNPLTLLIGYIFYTLIIGQYSPVTQVISIVIRSLFATKFYSI